MKIKELFENDELSIIKAALIGQVIKMKPFDGRIKGEYVYGTNRFTITNVEKAYHKDDYDIFVDKLEKIPHPTNDTKTVDHPYGQRTVTMQLKKLIGPSCKKVSWTEAGAQGKNKISVEIKM